MTSEDSYLTLIPTTDGVIRLIYSPTIFTRSVPWLAVLSRMPAAFLVANALNKERSVWFGDMLLRQALPFRLWISYLSLELRYRERLYRIGASCSANGETDIAVNDLGADR